MFKKGDLIRSRTWRDRLAIVICTSLSRGDLIRQAGHEVIQVNWLTNGVPGQFFPDQPGVSLVREDKIEKIKIGNNA
jgi:hypothetical protein